MKTVVVGFEGAWPTDSVVAWGAAAIEQTSDDGAVVARNGITGQQIRAADLTQLVKEGAVSPTARMPINEKHGAQIVVFAVRRAFAGQSFFMNDEPALARRASKDAWYRAYAYPQQFDTFVQRVVNDATASILREPTRTDAAAILRALTIMAPQNVLVHATRRLIAQADVKQRIDRTARATLQTVEQRQEYEQLVRVLDGGSYRYELKYTGGIAEGGGMDLDHTVIQLSALERVHKSFRPILLRRHAIFESVEDLPAPRLHELRAASAGLHFEVNVAGEPPIARLARFFELRMLEEAVSGHLDEELAADHGFMDSMQTLLHPSDDTLVEQKRTDADEYQEIEFTPVERERLQPDDRFVCFSFLQGIISDARNVELKAAPKLRYIVSTQNNGFGSPPEGADVLTKSRDFLFEPTVAKLTRFTTPSRSREKMYAEGVHILASQGPAEFSWIPSFFAPGALLRVGQHRAERDGRGLLLLNGVPVLEGMRTPSHERIAGWLETFASWCLTAELKSSPRPTDDWIVPVKPREPSPLARVLRVLGQYEGAMPLNHLVAELQELYGSRVRLNNTRRTIVANGRFVQLIEEEDDSLETRVELTTDGRRAAIVYRSYVKTVEP